MPYTTLFIDLDGTLYDNNLGLWQEISVRIDEFMHTRLGISIAEVPQRREDYFRAYGTTLRGLQENYDVDPADYLAFVHDIPLAQYLQPNEALRDMFKRLPQQKWIFTNADQNHAKRVLAALGLDGCFTGIVDVWAMEFVPKPKEAVYQVALNCAGESKARNCVMVDDQPRNLEPAQKLGFCTVLVGNNGEPHNEADYSIKQVVDLVKVLPGLIS